MSRGRVGVLAVVVMGVLAVEAGAAKRPSAFGNQSKPERAQVRILAVSSSSRQSFAGNQEIYLADVQVKHGERQFARLVDQYPGFGLPIRESLLRSRTMFTMKVTREPECDIEGSKVFLPQGGASIFDGGLWGTLVSHSGDTIPCYKALHQTVKVEK